MHVRIDSARSPSSAAPATIAECDDVCLTCGQSLREPAAPFVWRPVEHSWWPWLLVAVGVYLVVVFGARTWTAYPSLPSAPLELSCRLATEAGHMSDKMCAMAQRDSARFKLTAFSTVVGAVAILLGTARIVRQKRRAAASQQGTWPWATERRSWWDSMLAIVLSIWTVAESLLLASFQLALVVAGYVVILGLAEGEPLSLDLINGAIERTLKAATLVDVTLFLVHDFVL